MHWDDPSVILGIATIVLGMILNFVRVINNRLTRMELNHKEHAEKDDKRFGEIPFAIKAAIVEAESRMDQNIIQQVRVATLPLSGKIEGLVETLKREHEENRSDRKEDFRLITSKIELLGSKIEVLADRRNSTRIE